MREKASREMGLETMEGPRSGEAKICEPATARIHCTRHRSHRVCRRKDLVTVPRSARIVADGNDDRRTQIKRRFPEARRSSFLPRAHDNEQKMMSMRGNNRILHMPSSSRIDSGHHMRVYERPIAVPGNFPHACWTKAGLCIGNFCSGI